MAGHILVCSIGNPAPYANSLHSAGHVVVSALARMLSYTFERQHGSSVAFGSEFVLWQSGFFMNLSGPAVGAARRRYGGRHLVVVHDEMEIALGEVRVRPGSASHRGHNGLKSMRSTDYTRIAVGIGRPVERDSDAVSTYVLSQIKPFQRVKIESCASKVLDELRAIQ